MKGRKLLAWAVLPLLPLLLAAQGNATITRILHHRDVRSVISRIIEEVGPQGRVRVDATANRITVEDEAGRLKKINGLIDQLDVPARRFALQTRLDLFPEPSSRGLFKPDYTFVDATRWARDAKPRASYSCLMDLYEGGKGSCGLGDYRLRVVAGGFDPSRRRLAFASLSLTRNGRKGEPSFEILSGKAVLPEGSGTLFLVGASTHAPPLRLSIKPMLVPVVSKPGEG